jgi:hypothetical protein
MALAKPWMAAVGMTPEQMPQGRRRPSAICLSVPGEPDHRLGARRPARSSWPADAAQRRLVRAVLLRRLCVHHQLVNNRFAMRSPKLLLIDGGYWLVVLVLSGAIIGALGV